MSRTGDSFLVLGGPGTGKTTAMAAAVVSSIRSGGKPIVLARNRSSANQLRITVARSLVNGLLPHIATFHSLAFEVLTDFSNQTGLREFRVIDAASQDRRLREILRGSMQEGRVSWPMEFAEAIGTDGFSSQLRLFLSRAQKAGVAPSELVADCAADRLGLQRCVADLVREYHDVLDAEGVVDYSDVVSRAVDVLNDRSARDRTQGRFDAIFVDEYEDVDAAQRDLLFAVRAPEAALQLYADPDQSVESFRGGGLVGVDGLATKVLREQYRFGKAIGAAAHAVVERTGVSRIPRSAREGYRRHSFARSGKGEVELLTFENAHAQAEAIADTIRRAKLTGEVQRYADVAVIARGSSRDLANVERALRSAGIPCSPARAHEPLVRSRAVRLVLAALLAAMEPQEIALNDAAELLATPAFGIDPLEFRSLARQIRGGTQPQVLVELRNMLAELGRVATSTNSVAESIWTASSALGFSDEIDELGALIDLAAGFDEADSGRSGLRAFIDSMYEQRLSPRKRQVTHQVDQVTLTTAHQSRGLEWQLVILCDLQEGQWPVLMSKANLFETPPTMKAVIDEDRRLFYVATTRARSRLVLTAVAADGVEGGIEPSRFFGELAGRSDTHVRHHRGYHATPLTTAGVVASLRRALSDPDSSEAVQQAAAGRLRKLADAGVAAAHPDQWWGTRDWTVNTQPVRDVDGPIRVSGSSWESIDACSLRWFLEHEVNARTPSGPASNFGTIIHAVADSIARGNDPGEQQILEELSTSWASLGYEASWLADREFAEAVEALRRFRQWHESRPNRRLVATEVRFDKELSVPGDTVRATGVIDRLEVDEEAGMFVIDLKTKRKAQTKSELANHRQLSLYQAVVAESDLSSGYDVAGAELVELRIDDRIARTPKVQAQARVDVVDVRERLAYATATIRNEEFRPNPSPTSCRVCPFTQVCPAFDSIGVK